jgi:aryl-alcohol dehydrogenase-like predicted oxidoreductase
VSAKSGEVHSSDFRSTLPRFTAEALKANQALIDLLAKIGVRKKASPAQIALAWLLAQKPWIVLLSQAPRSCIAWRRTSGRPQSN